MFHEKKYSIILESPNVGLKSITHLIKNSFNIGLTPIIFLQDGIRYNNLFNHVNKISYLQTYEPRLREDNFKLITSKYVLNQYNDTWTEEIKSNLLDINVLAFGTRDTSLNDKVFLTNINDIILQNYNLIVFKQTDLILTDLFRICDIVNIKIDNDITYLGHMDYYFSKRDYGEIYYNENLSPISVNSIGLLTSNRINLYFIDKEYKNLIEKYNIAEKLFNTKEKVFSVNDSDISSMQSFLNLNKLHYDIRKRDNSDIQEIHLI